MEINQDDVNAAISQACTKHGVDFLKELQEVVWGNLLTKKDVIIFQWLTLQYAVCYPTHIRTNSQTML